MKKSILGVSFGYPESAPELLLQEALKQAKQEYGYETKMIRACELNLTPCVGCNRCKRPPEKGGTGWCPKPEDLRWYVDQIDQADGFILSIPVYDKMPAPRFVRFSNRFFGTSRAYLDHTWERQKAGAVIAVGEQDDLCYQTSIAFYHLTKMHMWNQLAATANIAMDPFELITDLDDQMKEQVSALADDLCQAVAGDAPMYHAPAKLHEKNGVACTFEPEVCPGCHSTLISITGDHTFKCTMCGSHGTWSVDETTGERKLCWDEESIRTHAYTWEAELIHRQNVDGKSSKKAALRSEEEVAIAGEPYYGMDIYRTPADGLPEKGKKRIVAISAGRQRGNGEALLCSALKAAKAYDPQIETDLIRLRDINIAECELCGACKRDAAAGGKGCCVKQNDDMNWVAEYLAEADAVIFGSGTYSQMPPYFAVNFMHRTMGLGKDYLDKRAQKPCITANMCIAGGPRFIFPYYFYYMGAQKVAPGSVTIEYQGFPYLSEKGQVVFNQDYLDRAGALGEHVAKVLAGKMPAETHKGECPHCGSNIFEFYKDGSTYCTLCDSFVALK